MAPETALSVEFWSLADLVPNPRNARLHSPEQIAQIRASIEEFGFTNPILLGDLDGEIVAGHGRGVAFDKYRVGYFPTGMQQNVQLYFILDIDA